MTKYGHGSLRGMPSFRIMAFKVVRGIPSRLAAARITPPVCRVATLLRRRLLGTHHESVSHNYLDYYVDEVAFRFNRWTSRSRREPFYRRLCQAVAADPVPRTTSGDAGGAGTLGHGM